MKIKNKNLIIEKLIPLSFILILLIIASIYINHRNIIITQQREQLVTIAKTASNNLYSFFEGSLKSLDGIFNLNDSKALPSEDLEKHMSKRITSYLSAEGDYIEELTYLSAEDIRKGFLQRILPIDDKILRTYIKDAIEYNKAMIGPWLYEEEGHYILYLFKAIIIDDSFQGMLVEKLNLNEIYDVTLENIKVGEYGYCTLKDQNGIILMHGNIDQIGMNSLQDRKTNYPELDPKGIEQLVKNQLKGEPGSDIIRSYWWGENEVKQVKKLIAYTPLNIGGYTWVVSTIMSYDEIADPINKTFYLLSILTLILFALLGYMVYYMTSIRKEKEKIILELQYREKLNEATNILRKHEDKLNHFNRIETIGMFASSVAHDLNNLLTPIFIYCEMLLDNLKDNPRAQSDVHEIQKSLNNCAAVTKTLLDYSKGNTLTTKIEAFNGNEVLQSCISLIRPMMPMNIKLNTILPQDTLILFGNKVEFKQIFLNLCTNAYQSMEKSGGLLTVEFYKEDNFALLKIKDTGCGIDDELKNEIFNPFYTSKTFEKGTGLGLPIVVRLIKNFHGLVDFESKKNIGTTFTVKFPLKN